MILLYKCIDCGAVLGRGHTKFAHQASTGHKVRPYV